MSLRSRAFALSIPVFAVALIHCHDNELVAPDGSHVDMTATPSQIATGGDSAVLTAVVTESDGRLVDDNTKVTFIASGGAVCALPIRKDDPCASGATVGVATAATHGGIASVLFRSGVAPLSATVKAISGTVQATATVLITALTAPSDAHITVQATPDTVGPNQTAIIQAFVATSSGGPVPDATRVLFSADSSIGGFSRSIVLTNQGFASTAFRAKKPGVDTIVVSSGTVKATTVVVAR